MSEVTRKVVVAIDGPSGAGKSSVARRVAKTLGYTYLDTGAMYRSVALAAQRAQIASDDADGLAQVASSADIRFEGDPMAPLVFLNGEDVTALIRTPEISQLASTISAHRPVRQVLVEQQRKLGEAGGVVAEGRDQTTVVFPQAEVKVFLTATAEERARRRALELTNSGMCVSYEEILRQQIERDERDSTRAESPLRVADDANVIESDGMKLEEVVQKVIDLCR